MNTLIPWTRRIAAFSMQAALLGAVPGLSWSAGPWAVAGSTGVADETVAFNATGGSMIVMDNSTATLNATSARASTVLRYPVQDVFGVGAGFAARLSMSFFDSGASSQIKAVLKSVDLNMGTQQRPSVVNLLTLDSDTTGATTEIQALSICQRPDAPLVG